MSGFFGIFRPQGGPVDLEAFDQMKTAIHQEDFDGMETHVEENIAVGHLMLRVSPESTHDKQPLESSCGNYLLAGHFRLDYRDELGDKLGLTQTELEVTPDSQLVMFAYQKWKEKFVNHLDGDWSCVVYDKIKNNAFLAKDKTGVSSLFYSIQTDQLVFSSDSRGILAVKKFEFIIHRSNFEKMQKLGSNFIDGTTLVKQLSFIKNGSIIEFDTHLSAFEKMFWEIPFAEELYFRYFEDYVSDFNYFYSSAIKSIIRPDRCAKDDTGIFLSSGLDSSSVCFFASKEFEFHSRDIYTFTSYPSHDIEDYDEKKIICNEMPIVKKYVSDIRNINPGFYKFSNYDLSLNFNKTECGDAYNPIISKNSFWLNEMLAEARRKGVKNILTGQVGNYTVTWSGGYHYADLLFRFKLIQLIKDMKSEFKLSGRLFLDTLKMLLIVPLVIYISNLYKSYKSENDINSKSLFDFMPSDYRKPSKKKITFIAFFFSNLLSQKKIRKIVQKNSILFCGISWATLSMNNAVQVVDPTADSRLIAFLNSIPHRLYFMNRNRKHIFKELMKDRIPNYILENKARKMQSFDFPLRMKYDSSFKEVIDKVSKECNQGISFNIAQATEILNKINSEPLKNLETAEVNILLRALSLKYFCNSLNTNSFT